MFHSAQPPRSTANTPQTLLYAISSVTCIGHAGSNGVQITKSVLLYPVKPHIAYSSTAVYGTKKSKAKKANTEAPPRSVPLLFAVCGIFKPQQCSSTMIPDVEDDEPSPAGARPPKPNQPIRRGRHRERSETAGCCYCCATLHRSSALGLGLMFLCCCACERNTTQRGSLPNLIGQTTAVEPHASRTYCNTHTRARPRGQRPAVSSDSATPPPPGVAPRRHNSPYPPVDSLLDANKRKQRSSSPFTNILRTAVSYFEYWPNLLLLYFGSLVCCLWRQSCCWRPGLGRG